jgi:ribosomal protein S18 acetylase RimI-like enzyme
MAIKEKKPAPAVKIRPARAEDAPIAAEIWMSMAVMHSDFDREKWQYAGDAQEQWQKWFAQAVSQEDMLTLAAVNEQDELVGFLVAKLTEPPPIIAIRRRAQIFDIAVKEGLRGKGIGTMLTKEAIGIFRKQGIQDVTLMVAKENELAEVLYLKLGFREVAHEMYMRL